MRIGDSFQEYSPIKRRRQGGGWHDDDDESPPPEPRMRARPLREDSHSRVRERHATVPERARVRSRERPVYPSSDEQAEHQETAAQRIARRRALRRKTHQRRLSPIRLLASVALAAVLALLALPYALQWHYQGRALPGISVQGLPVDDMDQQAIAAALRARHKAFLQQPVMLDFDGQTWHPSLEELGVTFALDQSMAELMQIGRQGGPFTRLGELWTLWQQGQDVAPRLVIDQQQLQAYLLNLAAQVNHPPRDAGLNILDERVLSRSGVPGRVVLVDESANDIMLALRTLSPQQVTLRTQLLEPIVNDKAMLAAQGIAEERLQHPVVLTHGENQWVWGTADLARLLDVETVDHSLVVKVNHDKLANEVEGLAYAINSGSVEPRVHFVNGALEIVQPGRTGWQLRQDEAFQVISSTLRQGSSTTRTVDLPIDKLRPRVTPEDMAELGITELVAEGLSSFAGSAEYRITNIKAGAARLDGVLIAPGEEFSFNRQLGAVNAENGFVEGYAVIGNRTKLEWGGGVCQNSTTVFRAAFWAGLPITERHAHPFYISWYDQFGLGPYGSGAGLDATIYTGLQDLTFVNDTGNWLLMQLQVDEINQVLSVQLYGTNPNNRQVDIDGPYISNQIGAPPTPVYIDDPSQPAGYLYQSDAARSGRDITIYRIVRENGVEVSRDAFFTRFKAWPDVYVRGTGG
jgi:vancomycin resistance protein YoaR